LVDTRALFERALSTIPAQKSKPIWDKFLHYEQQYGDLTTLFRVEKRRREAYPEDAFRQSGLEHVAQRYSYLDLDYVGKHEMGLSALRIYNKKHGKKDLLPGKAKPLTKGIFKPNLRNFVLFNPEDAPQAPPPPMIPVATVQLQVPDAIARLLSMIPSASQYRGPILPPDDLISLLVTFPQIPMPIITPPLVPTPVNGNMLSMMPPGPPLPPLHGSLPVLIPPAGMMPPGMMPPGTSSAPWDRPAEKRGKRGRNGDDGPSRKRMRDF